ncbi:hypothetical protein [Streptomyces uncialis]|uniref:Uncharacterized protein n=1 Tax=Streptomyces uncialis TaxID=1048205 RepID=A0A1Q4V163_9ACTN|nr:hypothetical protein [Streptomyces uncialis]OKH91480.1 hypothetical protein AB852_28395 [Streptomyces uncialis]
MTTTNLTLAGLAAVLAILWANLRPWWKGKRELKQLRAFGTGALLGTLSTMCAGGLLGWLALGANRVANTGGDKATLGTTGQSSASTLASGTLGQLTPEAAVVVFLITIGTVLAWREAGKQDKKRLVGGVFCGATLCLTAGVAGALVWLPDLLNAIGLALRGTAEGAGLL